LHFETVLLLRSLRSIVLCSCLAGAQPVVFTQWPGEGAFGDGSRIAVLRGAAAVRTRPVGHGYDDQGSKSDENGILRSWWQEEDEQRFQGLTKRLAPNTPSSRPFPGPHVNGGFTSGENIGDLSGVTVAHAAYRKSLNGKPAPVLDGFTGDQRFFLGRTQVWRSVYRDEYLRMVRTADVHSPDPFRVNGVVRNVDAWYDAFKIEPTHKLYLKPEDRVHIW
jgi:putative endopeptidase